MGRGRAKLPESGPGEKQLKLFERFDGMARRAEQEDPAGPATALACVVIALMGLGLLVQASHAATTLEPAAFRSALVEQLGFRCAGLVLLLAAYRVGPAGLRRFLPAACVLCCACLLLVFVPGLSAQANGAHRWLRLPLVGISFQPSELARIVFLVWAADRCLRLGSRVRDMRGGALPMLAVGLAVSGLILAEPDLGGAMLLLICFVATLWVGGARPMHVAGPLVGFGGAAFLVALSLFSYVRHRIDNWLGGAQNDQVDHTTRAIASGDWLGVGFGRGMFRNARVPYLESDYVFALIGEELGLVGMLLVLGLFAAFAWYGMRLVLSIRDRFGALAAFGLLFSVALQAMIHVQVVTRLVPPKGMTLPFVSHGGTALVVSSLAVGLALGASRPALGPAYLPTPSPSPMPPVPSAG